MYDSVEFRVKITSLWEACLGSLTTYILHEALKECQLENTYNNQFNSKECKSSSPSKRLYSVAMEQDQHEDDQEKFIPFFDSHLNLNAETPMRGTATHVYPSEKRHEWDKENWDSIKKCFSNDRKKKTKMVLGKGQLHTRIPLADITKSSRIMNGNTSNGRSGEPIRPVMPSINTNTKFVMNEYKKNSKEIKKSAPSLLKMR